MATAVGLMVALVGLAGAGAPVAVASGTAAETVRVLRANFSFADGVAVEVVGKVTETAAAVGEPTPAVESSGCISVRRSTGPAHEVCGFQVTIDQLLETATVQGQVDDVTAALVFTATSAPTPFATATPPSTDLLTTEVEGGLERLGTSEITLSDERLGVMAQGSSWYSGAVSKVKSRAGAS